MQLNEIFGMGKKEPAKNPQQLEDEEEARRMRMNKLRTSDKPAPTEIMDKKPGNPEAMQFDEFLDWLGKSLETQGRYESEGPQKGDFVMSKKLGGLTIVDPNGGGNMIAIVEKDGKRGKMSWDKLSKPVKGQGKQYYAYG